MSLCVPVSLSVSTSICACMGMCVCMRVACAWVSAYAMLTQGHGGVWLCMHLGFGISLLMCRVHMANDLRWWVCVAVNVFVMFESVCLSLLLGMCACLFLGVVYTSCSL